MAIGRNGEHVDASDHAAIIGIEKQLGQDRLSKMNGSKRFFFGFISLACAFFYLSWVTHWADSELWPLGLARSFNFASSNDSVVYKFLFYQFLRFPYLFPLGNVATIHLARLLFALIGTGIAILTFQISMQVTKKRELAFFSVLMLVCSSFFLSQGFRLRSDILASFFQLCGLWAFLKLVQTQQKRYSLLSGFSHILLLLSTPKAFLHFVVNAIFIFLFWRTRKKEQVKKHLFFALRIPEFFFVFLLISQREHFFSAIHFFMSSYQENIEHPAFFSAQGFFYVIRFLNDNPIFTFLFILAPFAWGNVEKRFRIPVLGAATFSVLFVIGHSEKLPFFILSMLPLVMIYVTQFSLSFEWAKNRYFRIFLMIALFANAIFYTIRFATQNQNNVQVEAVQNMESYLQGYKEPRLTYFDGNAVLPRDTQVFAFISATVEGNLIEVLKTLQNLYDVVFMSNRMAFYAHDILDFLEKNNYIHIGGGAFGVSKFHILPKNHSSLKISTDQICLSRSASEPVYFYEGNNFMTMRPISAATQVKGQTVAGGFEGLNSGMTAGELNRFKSFAITSDSFFVACTFLKPFHFPGELQFAQIFDVDSNF